MGREERGRGSHRFSEKQYKMTLRMSINIDNVCDTSPYTFDIVERIFLYGMTSSSCECICVYLNIHYHVDKKKTMGSQKRSH